MRRGAGPATSLRRRLALVSAILAVVLAGVAVAAGLALAHQSSARSRVIDQADPARLEAQVLLAAYVDEETGVRGYVLTGRPSFLQPYADAVATVPGRRQRLAALVAGDPAAQRLLAATDAAAAAWVDDFAAPAIATTQAGSRAEASDAAQSAGKARFDTLRARFAALDGELLARRQGAVHALAGAADTVLVVLVVALGLLAAALVAASVALGAWVLRPLDALRRQVRRVASGELAATVVPAGPAELAALGADVEVMRRRIVDELHSVAATYGQLADANARLEAANADLERSNVELEQFAYVASHDLQEPLRKVVGFTELLQRRYGGQLDERADQYIAFASDGAARMQVLINDLLAFSRVGRSTAGFDDVDLGDALAAAVAALATAIEESGATLVVPELPVVRGDRTLLVALWQNLLGNAIKFRAEAPPRVEVTCEAGAGSWELAVTDNGIGIEPRFAERVFVIFQRLHAKDRYGGTGIGLALCKKIVEHHGGSIWVDTDHPGPGTRIRLSLPTTLEERP